MAHRVAIDLARLGFPARTAFTIATGSAGIKAEAANDHEDVALPDVDRDPVALSFFPVVEESTGNQLALEESGLAEDIACRSTTIVTPVIELGMPASVFVGLVHEPVRCRDRALYFLMGKERSLGFSILLQVHRAHEFLFVLDAALGPFLRAAATDESEAGEEKESELFH